MIKLDINIGDIILVGRFKNKRIEVKEIGIDEHGLPTINGRSILKIRIEKLMKTEKQIKENLYPMLKVGTKIKVHKHAGIFIDGVITSRKSDYITYDSKMGSGGVNLNAKDLDDRIQFDESKQFNLMNIVKKILKEMRDMDDEYLEMAENIADEYKDFIDKRSIEHEQTDDEGSYTLEFTMVIPISHDDYYSVEDAEEGYQERFNDGPGVEGNPGGQVIHVNVSDVSKEGKNWAVTLYVRGGYDI